MTCADVEQVLPELLDGAPDSAFQNAFEGHLKSCPDCSDLVSDLKLISNSAQELAEAEEPPQRVWVRIAAELRAEGIIHEPTVAQTPPARARWSAWWLAPIAAALIVAGSYVVNHRSSQPVARQQAPAASIAPGASPATTPGVTTSASSSLPLPSAAPTATAPAVTAPSATQTARLQTASPESALANVAIASASAGVIGSVKEPRHIVEPAPSAEDQQFLSVVSTRAPSMRASYENQLQSVNADIREAQAYLNRNPADADARQQLMDAYQQKAMLYQIALDRIQ
jgi:predicted anti-sigma-YlaC factor YlaD